MMGNTKAEMRLMGAILRKRRWGENDEGAGRDHREKLLRSKG